MKQNEIFTDGYMKKLKQAQYSGCDLYSLKKIVLLLAIRCQELETAFRVLEDEVRTQKEVG